jgi:hypothetical protein
MVMLYFFKSMLLKKCFVHFDYFDFFFTTRVFTLFIYTKRTVATTRLAGSNERGLTQS